MPYLTIIVLYNLVLPVFFIVAFPAWLIKMWRRGGYGTGLMQRFGKFKSDPPAHSQGGTYVHAVSVGEVNIALKLIKGMLAENPQASIVLAATTSTGHAVARQNAPEGVEVIYSPIDFRCIVRKVLRRYQPRNIVLIEAEVWPNMLDIAKRENIPIAIVNARLSERSEERFQKLSGFIFPLWEKLDLVAVQNEGDAKRFQSLGISQEVIHITGSIKFDPAGGALPQRRNDFQQQLDDFSGGKNVRPVILAASTHAGEEKLIAKAVQKSGIDALLLIVPRHAERRAEVVSDLEELGLEVVLRSNYRTPSQPNQAVLVADTTGELRDWTAHADLVIIGKSWLSHGGQNPAEAISAGVPLVTGPHMENFEPLVTMLCEADGMKKLRDIGEMAECLVDLLGENSLPSKRENLCQNALRVLKIHDGAVKKTVSLLEKLSHSGDC